MVEKCKIGRRKIKKSNEKAIKTWWDVQSKKWLIRIKEIKRGNYFHLNNSISIFGDRS